MKKYEYFPPLPSDICQIFKPRPPFFFKLSKKDKKIRAGIKIQSRNERHRSHVILFGKISHRIPIYKKIYFKENNEIFLKKNLPLYQNSEKLLFQKIPLDTCFSSIYFKKQISKNFSKFLDFKKILIWRQYNSKNKMYSILPIKVLKYFSDKIIFFKKNF